MALILKFSDDFPAQFRAEIRSFCRKWREVYFQGIDDIAVRVAEENGDKNGAATSVDPEYHRTNMQFATGWFSLDVEERTRYLHHEFSHQLTARSWGALWDITKAMEGPLAELLRESLARKAQEEDTEDVARAIQSAYALGVRDGAKKPKKRRKR